MIIYQVIHLCKLLLRLAGVKGNGKGSMCTLYDHHYTHDVHYCKIIRCFVSTRIVSCLCSRKSCSRSQAPCKINSGKCALRERYIPFELNKSCCQCFLHSKICNIAAVAGQPRKA